LALFRCRVYAIVAITFGTPRIVCMKHHWTHSLCDMCCNKYKGILSASIDDCNFSVSCKCKICLRQPPSLRGLASHTVFHFIYYIKHFKLTNDHYVYAAFSQTVHVEKLIPNTFPVHQCEISKQKKKIETLGFA
jgi:hypothetical protein